MSYSPSALNAAMTKSLKFENINNKETITTCSLCKLNSNSIYKFNIVGEDFIIITEILGNKIMYVNSYTSDKNKETFKLSIGTIDNRLYLGSSVGTISGAINLEVEYSFDSFELDFIEVTNDNLLEYNFNEQYFTDLKTATLTVSKDLEIGTISATTLDIKNTLKFGNWIFSLDSNQDNKITLSYNSGATT